MINRQAVFSLPPEMFGFYKHHLGYIEENAVNPDRRRYAVEGEEENHFLDADVYGDSVFEYLPKYWLEAVDKVGEDTLRAYGIVPWTIQRYKFYLTEAFKNRDPEAILRLSSDLGHYIGDANVPLHSTENYNGQLTGQHGIHGLWESRLPELFAEEYNLWIGQAQYLFDPAETAWTAIRLSHAALDSVLLFEREITARLGVDHKFGFGDRMGVPTRVYSEEFSRAYHEALAGMVERRMRASIQMVADFWFTCWVDAGQPEINTLTEVDLSSQNTALIDSVRKWSQPLFSGRGHQ
ncbi:MAG: zinc dependent phospholipase C family protein [Bacteroidota bacterium]